MRRPRVGGWDTPEIEVRAARLGGGLDGSPPRQVVAHQLTVGAAAPCKQAVGAALVTRDEHCSQRPAAFGGSRGVGAAPGKEVEEQLVVDLPRQIDGLALFTAADWRASSPASLPSS